MSEVVKIYTDGACLGNPGPGGWGAVLMWKESEKELSGGEAHTTNNRMELLATIRSLEALKETVTAEIYTDSRYVRDGIDLWIKKWKQNGWKTASKQPVKNVDLWQKLDELCRKHTLSWHWVKAHVGHVQNERADTLARTAAAGQMMTNNMSAG